MPTQLHTPYETCSMPHAPCLAPWVVRGAAVTPGLLVQGGGSIDLALVYFCAQTELSLELRDPQGGGGECPSQGVQSPRRGSATHTQGRSELAAGDRDADSQAQGMGGRQDGVGTLWGRGL